MARLHHTRNNAALYHARLALSDCEEREAEYTNTEGPRTSPAPSLPDIPSAAVLLYSDHEPSDDGEDLDFRMPVRRAE